MTDERAEFIQKFKLPFGTSGCNDYWEPFLRSLAGEVTRNCVSDIREYCSVKTHGYLHNVELVIRQVAMVEGQTWKNVTNGAPLPK